jgi:hypothetical protein
MQSRIERVANMVPATREDSIKRFLDAASDYGTYVDSSDDDTSDQKVKEIYTSRTMIYKDEEDSDRNHARIQKAPKSSFPEEDLIEKTEWSCYGSTQVHYLVLDPVPTVKKVPNRKPDPNVPPEIAEAERQAEEMFDVLSKQLQNFDDHFNNKKNNRQVVTKVATSSGKGGKITAITPENFGLSVRKMDTAVGHYTITDIGSIRICLETSSSLVGDESSDAVKKPASNSAKEQDEATDTKKQLDLLGDKSNTDKSSNSNTDQSAIDGSNKPSPFDPKTFYNFTLKVGQHMRHNVHELKEAMSDDFPGRTIAFGTKVVNRVEKTTEQTFTYMAKVFDSWWKGM